MRSLSLRNRLLVAVALILVTVAAGGLAVARSQHRELISQVDRLLAAAVPATRAFANRALPGDGNVVAGPGGGGGTGGLGGGGLGGGGLGGLGGGGRLTGNPSELFVGRLGLDGNLAPLLERSLQPAAEPLVSVADAMARTPGPDAAPRAGGPASAPWTVPAVGGGSRYRVVTLPLRDGSFLVAALSLERADDTFDRLMTTLGVVAAAVVLVVGLTVFWVLRLGIRPLRHMTEAAVAITGGDVHRRVDPAPAGTEAGALGRALNVMLDERQRTEDRLRQFVADASHELRTPLTSIRGYVELYRAGGLADEDAQRDAMRRVGQEAGRMSGLVEDLLRLARLDLGRPVEVGAVDLAMLARDAAADARAVQPDRPVEVDAPGSIVVPGDEALLRQAVGAAVANALVHTDPRVPVTVRVRAGDGAAVLEVADTGPGMTEEVAAHAFDRFFRGDPGRSRHRGGSGLGLSIVRSVLQAHGGSASVRTAPGEGTTVVLELPR